MGPGGQGGVDVSLKAAQNPKEREQSEFMCSREHCQRLRETRLAVRVADKDHLMEQLAVCAVFGHNFPENQQQLLDGVVVTRHDVADDRLERGKGEWEGQFEESAVGGPTVSSALSSCDVHASVSAIANAFAI